MTPVWRGLPYASVHAALTASWTDILLSCGDPTEAAWRMDEQLLAVLQRLASYGWRWPETPSGVVYLGQHRRALAAARSRISSRRPTA